MNTFFRYFWFWYFQDLPAISDETETGDELHKENHQPVQSILKRNHSEERKKASAALFPEKVLIFRSPSSNLVLQRG